MTFKKLCISTLTYLLLVSNLISPSFGATKEWSLSESAIESDINYLFSTYEKIHPNLYHNVEASVIKEQVQFILEDSDSYKNQQDLFKALSPIVNQLKDSHTYVGTTLLGQLQSSSQNFAFQPVLNNHYELIDDSTIIFDLNTFDLPIEDFQPMLDQLFKEIDNNHVSHLIIDCRDNPGGDATLGALLFEHIYRGDYRKVGFYGYKISKEILELQLNNGWIDQAIYDEQIKHIGEVSMTSHIEEGRTFDNKYCFDGNIYLLTNENTRSAAVMFASLIKDYNAGTIIGAETGDKASGYTANYEFELPNTKLRAGVSWQYIGRPSGLDTGRGLLPDYYTADFDMDTLEIALKLIQLK